MFKRVEKPATGRSQPATGRVQPAVGSVSVSTVVCTLVLNLSLNIVHCCMLVQRLHHVVPVPLERVERGAVRELASQLHQVQH